MNNYTIQKIENDIILTLPTTATYHNKYRDIYYLNNNKGIQIKRKYQPIATAHLESIKIEAENITSATSDDITFQFRTMTGGVVSVECGENTSELVTNVTSQLTPQDFYLDAVGGIGNNLHIADFINTVLIDVFSNSVVLDELCADEEVVANPCPECPECPECPNDMWNTLFNTLLEEEWIGDTSIGISAYDENGFDAYCNAKDTSDNNTTNTWTMDGETIATKGIPWDRTEPVQLTITDGDENTVTVDVPVQMLWQSTQFDFDFAGYRTYQEYINPSDDEEQQE